MKIRFYSIQDLYDEVKDTSGIVRMQFLQQTYSQEYRGAGEKSFVPIQEQILTLTIRRGNDILYYSQPYHRCVKYEIKRWQEEINKKAEELEAKVRKTFKGYNIKKGVYEDEAQ